MINFTLNGQKKQYNGPAETSLLDYLRLEENLTSVKEGCSGQGTCGACTVEINGKPRLACTTPIRKVEGAEVTTMEGIPKKVQEALVHSFSEKGAVQCGYCSPGMIMRVAHLFRELKPMSREEIFKAISPNLCRCTGYIKIVDAIEEAFKRISNPAFQTEKSGAKIGDPLPKYESIETAMGKRLFVNDLYFEGMLFGVLKFSEHPRAVILNIDLLAAEKQEGVIKIFTARDIPGERYSGLIFKDWPLMVDVGERTNCISDVLAVVVAETEALARKATEKIKVEYKTETPVTDMMEAVQPESPQVHNGQSNVLETSRIRFGNPEKEIEAAPYKYKAVFETQRIEHAFLETETAVALPENDCIKLYSQGQGVYVDRQQIASFLNLPEEKVHVIQVSNGGGFGGKEDLTVQGHATLCSWLLQKPVKVHLTREESIRMHPKRHPVRMEMELACNETGKFAALALKAFGDSGAYASVGTKVMERVVGHATGAYTVPNVDIEAHTIYTNNIPSGAMRGFGVPQVVYAIESCIDEICNQGGFDRWQIRYDNALENGAKTATGQELQGVGLKQTLLAVKQQFQNAKFAGIACGLKNTGVGNGMIDDSEVKIEIISEDKVIIHHGWSEMGQGVHNMAIQTLHQETSIQPEKIEVMVDTAADIPTGMTTSSRATALVGNAIRDAAKSLASDLKTKTLNQLAGQTYKGKFICDWTSKPDPETEKPVIHFSYGYATQVVILHDNGKIQKVIAAHDGGKIMNKMLFEGQIQGAVHMGLGYALTEDLPMKDGKPVSYKLNDLGILRAKEMPEVEVIGIEEKDPIGPYGAKGIGEIGMVPTAAAVANAFCQFNGIRHHKLPMKRKIQSKN
ncbi:MAG: selenium-dependent xanthine dehydrogenase [Bacteroidales bacterium]|nr:selenium-dependent xanthine dehydrogenase [Bacteroidales bacterium]MCF8404716.1 selenium-dependent xanthine dehydrogenase [Bacteroidales bacterium]